MTTGVGIVTASSKDYSVDGYFNEFRVDAHGSPLVNFTGGGPWEGIAADGYYFKACNPTFGTGIAMGIQTSFSDTSNVLMIMRNTYPGSAGLGPYVFPDYIRLLCTAAGTGISSSHIAIIVDIADRYNSGGTSLTPGSANTGVTYAAAADIHFGAITANAVVTKAQITRAQAKVVNWVVGDQLLINFGSNGGSDGYIADPAAARQLCIDCGTAALAPGNDSLLLHMWNPGNNTTPPSWEVEVGWWEY